MIIKGFYLDGKTSKRVTARLDVLANHSHCTLHVSEEGSTADSFTLKFPDIKIESRLGSTPREISFGNDQLFVSEDHDAIDTLAQLQHPAIWTGLIHKLESHLGLVITATLVTLSIIWLTFSTGIPKSAEYIAFQLPDLASNHFGSTLAVLDETMFDPSELESEQQTRIQALAQPYLQSEPSLNAKLVFRSSNSANAFALPSGHIVFTDDIVHLASNDQELLAILFHELGHLKYKHLLRRVLQDSMVTLALVLITGDLDTIEIITGLPTIMLDLQYSKDFESEADYFAIQQLHTHNMSVDAFAEIMKKLETVQLSPTDENADKDADTHSKKSTLSQLFSTHPSTQARIDMVANFKKTKAPIQ